VKQGAPVKDQDDNDEDEATRGKSHLLERCETRQSSWNNWLLLVLEERLLDTFSQKSDR